MARRRGSSRLRQQARAQAALRVSPERSALFELAREAEDTRDATIQAAKGAAAGIKQAVHAARPGIHAIYAEQGKSQSEADAAILSDLSKLSGSADPFRAAFDRESAGAARRVAQSQAASLKELSDRAVAAEEGRAFAVTNASGTFQSNIGKIQRRLIDVAREEGLSASTALGELEESAAKRRVTRRGQNITAQGQRADRRLRRETLTETERHNREAEQRARSGGGRGGSKGSKGSKGKAYKRPEGQASKQHDLVRSVNNAASIVRQLHGKGEKFPDIRFLLSRQKSKDNPYGGHEQDIISAAIDLVGAGYLRPVNERTLRQAGLYAVPRNWRRSKKVRPKASGPVKDTLGPAIANLGSSLGG